MNKPGETSRVLGGRQIEVYPNLKRLMLLVGANDQANKEHRVLLAEIVCGTELQHSHRTLRFTGGRIPECRVGEKNSQNPCISACRKNIL